nr:capsid [Hebeloma mesophaeum partitivirus 3]
MSFFSRFGKGTRSRFSKAPKDVALPAPIETTPPTRELPAPAKDHDKKADEDKPLDETLVPPERPVRERLHKSENKAQEGQSSTEPHTQSDSIGTETIFQISWRSEANYRMIAEHFPETNYYVPSSLALFSLLEAAENRINSTKHIQEHEVYYLPYAVKVYYAYMYYIQILRARRDSGHIEGFENSLLKRFEVKYPMTSLPCAQIVYGYFSTIISTELAEAKYDWIVPRIALPDLNQARPADKNLRDFDITNGAAFLQPLVPHMVGLLNSFIHHPTDTLNDHMIDGDTYEPMDLEPAAHADVPIFGGNIRDNTDTNRNIKDLMSCAGMSTPFIFGNQNYAQAAKHARRTDFGRDIKHVVDTATHTLGQNLVNNVAVKDLDTFLLMPKSSNLKFFAFLRDQAVIHARFHDKVYHFSDVQTTGGLETTVITQLKLGRSNANRSYADVHVGTQQQAQWYRQPFRDVQAGFATNRSGLRRNEELQAFAYGTNMLLPITGMDLLANHGTFWDNREWIQTLFLDTPAGSNVPTVANLTNTGKPMYADHSSMVLRCFREKPHGTGVVDNEFD